MVVWYAYDLPNVDDMDGVSRAPNVTIVADDGTKIASFGGIYGEPVGIASLPPYLPQAVIAVEDRRFYDHFGVDLRGLARAYGWTFDHHRCDRPAEGPLLSLFVTLATLDGT